ncbi:MAG: hypothetical protein RIC56_12615 [Pseudomonadales bacterium]
MLRFLRIYVLPGAILQSVNIAGGYGTGRELVEFFTRHGMGNGLAGMLVATTLMSLIFALSLMIAQRYRVYDYRSFFKVLLGRAWFLFEMLAVLLFILVLAVMGAAAGEILSREFGLPRLAGGAALLVAVVVLNFFGRDWVTRVLAGWSVFLYLVFGAYFVSVLASSGPMRDGTFAWHLESAWAVSALQYALYNVAGIPVILYAARAIENGRQAVAAGVAGGLITMIPALMFHLSFAGAYPGIVTEQLPVYTMFERLSVPLLNTLYLVVLFGTFVETGAGNIQGLIERLDAWWQERRGATLSRGVHAGVATVALVLASLLSAVGVVDLIAGGYGRIAWGYLVVFIVPLFTVGVYRLVQGRDSGP